MAWTIELSRSAERSLKKLDRQTSRQIADFIDLRLVGTDNPRQIGKPLQGVLRDYWSYRVGDYRLICELQDGRLVILVVELGRRRDIYR